uniref:DUF1810 family protein n=1 Tax=Psychrobacter sp. TaxID=56811 RepID=UPI0015EEDB8B|nr:DUF1810 family protein [Psychrobacter sp.]
MSLQHFNKSASEIFVTADNSKLYSSSTFFALAAYENLVFEQVWQKFFVGKYDTKTITVLEQ